jgi:hypothetical protein
MLSCLMIQYQTAYQRSINNIVRRPENQMRLQQTTAAIALRRAGHKAHGTSGARLKMSYFLDRASNKLRYDIYSLSGERRAAGLLRGLDAFGRCHWYLSTLTIESVPNACPSSRKVDNFVAW